MHIHRIHGVPLEEAKALCTMKNVHEAMAAKGKQSTGRYTLNQKLKQDERSEPYICSFCGSERKRLTIWQHRKTGEKLYLCFLGCQNFPEPYRDSESGPDNWKRIDPWQNYKKQFPKLRGKSRNITENIHQQTLS